MRLIGLSPYISLTHSWNLKWNFGRTSAHWAISISSWFLREKKVIGSIQANYLDLTNTISCKLPSHHPIFIYFLFFPTHFSNLCIPFNPGACHKYYHAKIPQGTQPHSDPNIASVHNAPPLSHSIPPSEPFSHYNTEQHSMFHGPERGTSSCGNHSAPPQAAVPRVVGCSPIQGRWGRAPIETILLL